MAIRKSEGVTPTERFLAGLCDRTFLKLWSYPNPCREDGKELCDLLVVFENEVLIFFDRESRRFDRDPNDLGLAWERWRKEVIDKQISTAEGAARYLRKGRAVFLDDRQRTTFPIPIDAHAARIHKIVVAHGARDACRAHCPDNVSGSLAISYSNPELPDLDQPFFIELDRRDPVHIFDTENLEIVLSELDTIVDFTSYLQAKVNAIARYRLLTYCGEEDLVAHYLINFDRKLNRHIIGPEGNFDFIFISEGEWEGFARSEAYKARKKANRSSYLWDRLIQITSDNALNDRLTGNSDPFSGKSAIHFMAKEPRFMRRGLADRIQEAIESFPESTGRIVRNVSFMPSFWKGTAYVFLQLKVLDKGDYELEYRPKRQALLEVACGAAKIKWPELQRIIGIAIDAPKYAPNINSEDLALMEFDGWNEAMARRFAEANKEIRFFATEGLRKTKVTISEFPQPVAAATRDTLRSKSRASKVGRNDPCPCGSGMKFKKCCGR